MPEEISTIFVGGFPPDAKPRELDNLCRFLPGFVTSNTNTGKGITLFVLFDTPHYAHAAISVLSGQVFDRSGNVEPMRATMARNNMKRSGGPSQAPGAPYPTSKGGWGGGAPPHQPPPPTHAPPPGHAGMESAGAKRPRMYEDPSQVDTVASVGAAEQGFDEDTLRAFFEACPGFLDFKPNPRSGGGFAKFASHALAAQVIEMARNEGIPCDMAKSSMGATGAAGHYAAPPPAESGYGGGNGWGGGHRAATYIAPAPSDGGAKRPRIPEDSGQVDTVASVGAVEAGYDEQGLHLFFQAQEGFVAFKGNPRMGGGFAKFASHALAVQAMQVSKDSGVPAAIARSSMSVT